ncbi:unnamed protein product, partial [Symbiodinium necroappetens]
ERLTETAKDSKAMDHAKSRGWLDQDQHWRVLRWNSLQQHLEVDESLKPTSTSDLIGQIIQVRKGVTEDSLLRFKSLRRLSPDVKADWIQFQLVISLRAEVALHNTSQLFYLNSTAYAIAWTTLQAKLHGAGSMDLVPALRILCKLRSSALPLKLLAQFPWATLLQGWPHIHQQHDAPELVTHLMPRLGITHVAGRWEARWRVNQQVQVFDHGTLLAPITMALPPGESLHLQQVIQQWHSQARLHALAIAPVFLCVQLNRFTGDDGELSRDTRPLQGIDCTIRIPVFTATDTLQIRQVPFQVTSAQLHFGERPTSGHYRAVLKGQKAFGASQTWITDDNQVPQSASNTHPGAIYLLGV